jgi:hypothetical protein
MHARVPFTGLAALAAFSRPRILDLGADAADSVSGPASILRLEEDATGVL